MTPAALALLLPVAPRPGADERLSSWLSRIARIYGLSASALLGHFGLAGASALTLEKGFSVGQGALIAARTGLSAPAIEAMAFSTLAPHAHFMIAPSARYFCPRCAQTPAVGRKDAALPWTFWCSAHGVRLWAREKRPMGSFLPESVLERLDPLARRGGRRRGGSAPTPGSPVVALGDAKPHRHAFTRPAGRQISRENHFGPAKQAPVCDAVP